MTRYQGRSSHIASTDLKITSEVNVAFRIDFANSAIDFSNYPLDRFRISSIAYRNRGI